MAILFDKTPAKQMYIYILHISLTIPNVFKSSTWSGHAGLWIPAKSENCDSGPSTQVIIAVGHRSN